LSENRRILPEQEKKGLPAVINIPKQLKKVDHEDEIIAVISAAVMAAYPQ
jgi:hypothetical protein